LPNNPTPANFLKKLGQIYIPRKLSSLQNQIKQESGWKIKGEGGNLKISFLAGKQSSLAVNMRNAEHPIVPPISLLSFLDLVLFVLE
jgi:hypothetical protein